MRMHMDAHPLPDLEPILTHAHLLATQLSHLRLFFASLRSQKKIRSARRSLCLGRTGRCSKSGGFSKPVDPKKWYIMIYINIYIHIMIYFDILWWMVLPNRLQDSLPGLQRTLRGGGSSGWLETEWFHRLPMVFFWGKSGFLVKKHL